MKNIYLIGDIYGAYRTQNMIKTLLDGQNRIFFCNIRSLRFPTSFKLTHDIYRTIVNLFGNILSLPHKIYSISLADIVIVTAMNNSKRFEFRLSKLLRKKIITDYYISYHDSWVHDRKRIRENSFKARRLQRAERDLINGSSLVLFLNTTEAARYTRLVDADLSKISYKIVPLCIEEKAAVNLPFFSRKRDYISICWWGAYIPLHGLEKIIEAGRILKERRIGFKMHLFGNSKKESTQYVELVEKLCLNDSVVIRNDYTFQNGKLEEFLINNCDVVLGNFGDSEKAKNVLVNKLIDGVAMRAPVLTGESVAPREFFNGETDIFYTKNRGESIAQSVELISNMKLEIIRSRTNNAYEIYKRNFSVQNFKEKIDEIIDVI